MALPLPSEFANVLGSVFAPPSPGFQESTGPNPEELASPPPPALRVQSLLGACPVGELPVTVDKGGVSHGDGVTKEAYSHRGSFICFMCLMI